MSRAVRRVVVFVAGLLLILLGLVLIVLPGPLTIPPILLGVWLWSLEFEFARRNLTEEQKSALQKKLEDMRKSQASGLPAGQKFCPSCDGACRLNLKP